MLIFLLCNKLVFIGNARLTSLSSLILIIYRQWYTILLSTICLIFRNFYNSIKGLYFHTLKLVLFYIHDHMLGSFLDVLISQLCLFTRYVH